jgi:hypothetical protein
MSATTAGKRIASATHSGVTMNETIGGRITERTNWGENRPSTRVSPALWMEAYSLEAEVTCQSVASETIGTKATLTINFEEIGGTSGSCTISNMRLADVSYSGESAPYTFTCRFVYDAGSSENISPITYSF